MGKNANASAYFSTPTGMTEKHDASNVPYGPSIAADDMVQASSGSVGSKSSTISGGKARNWATQQIALRPSPGEITFDNASNTVVEGDTSGTLSFATAGSNRVLIVSVTNQGFPPIDAASVTYNGVPLTEAVRAQGDWNASVWYLVNPPTGPHDIIVSFPSAAYFSIMATSLDGVDQVTGIGAIGTSSDVNVGTSASLTLTTTQANSWLVDGLHVNSTDAAGDVNPIATGSNQTIRNATFIPVSRQW